MAEFGNDKSIARVERVLGLLFDELMKDERREEPLVQLSLARMAAQYLRGYEWELAHRATAAGATWADIGAEIGTTRQGAQRRYSRRPNVEE